MIRRRPSRNRPSGLSSRPPRQIDVGVPEELERVCLKALTKRPDRRYPTAGAMAEDLRRYLGGRPEGLAGGFRWALPDADAAAGRRSSWPRPGITRTDLGGVEPSRRRSHGVVRFAPRGLRPFGAEDADVYPDLLPGPRGHNGLPECIDSWRSRIEGRPGDTFRVGLIFGPSGVGKTSLVRAGILPRLSGRILSLYIEAEGECTESRLLRGIRGRCRGVPRGASLAATLVALRKGIGVPRGRKVLLVLDQFERWLQGGWGPGRRALVSALRQCDGEHLQALAVVRDDTWAAASRFMRDVGDPIVEGGNSAAVDLFDLGHARRVLEWFGRSYGVLPAGTEDLTTDQQRFLDRAVPALSEGGQVLPIRLSLLAEAVRRRAWLPRTFEAIRTGDVALTFLEETFDSETTPHMWRRHRAGACSVLRALLPGVTVPGSGTGGDPILSFSWPRATSPVRRTSTPS